MSRLKPEVEIERDAPCRSWMVEVSVDGYYSVFVHCADNGSVSVEVRSASGGLIADMVIAKEKLGGALRGEA